MEFLEPSKLIALDSVPGHSGIEKYHGKKVTKGSCYLLWKIKQDRR
ncbi:MAG: hypothetical protein M3250_05625 [Thermoproteota archaeon]|nr:hypothetical protein [Thermoproteota archaeon]